MFAAGRFPQSSGRQKLVTFHGTVVIHQQDAQTRLYVAVLKGIIQQDDFRIGCSFRCCQSADTFAAVSVHGDTDVGKLAGHLIRLISDVLHAGGRRGQHEAFRFPLVAPAQHGQPERLVQ